ncbi:MAG: hypothetical protein ACXWW6_06780 [Candidatus Limnocylindrales bacterium]
MPGRIRIDARLSHPLLLAALVIALVACDQATVTDEPSIPTPPTASEPAAPTGPASSEAPGESAADPPSASTEPATPQPTEASSARATVDPGSVVACSGSDENRDFYASMATAVDWTVYCPVLPDGWFVDDGQYRLAGGGWMEIGYDGPGDARILLLQGAICASTAGCTPVGTDVGETAFGDRVGVVVAGPDASWSVVVDRGAELSWLLVVRGVDEAGAKAIAADLLAIAG